VLVVDVDAVELRSLLIARVLLGMDFQQDVIAIVARRCVQPVRVKVGDVEAEWMGMHVRQRRLRMGGRDVR
jgi:hypothetical protein